MSQYYCLKHALLHDLLSKVGNNLRGGEGIPRGKSGPHLPSPPPIHPDVCVDYDNIMLVCNYPIIHNTSIMHTTA